MVLHFCCKYRMPSMVGLSTSVYKTIKLCLLLLPKALGF